MRIFFCQSLLILLAVTLGSVCPAQDSPFDAPDAGVFGEPASDRASIVAEDSSQDPLITQLNEHASRGNLQLADAVSSLARIGQWSDVDRILSAAASRNISQREMAEMVRRIGPSILMRIELHEGISAGARSEVKKLGDAAKAEAESPDRLRRAIDGLDADSVDARLAAAREILSGGNVAIAELVAAAVSENPPAARDDILRAMLRLGSGGTKSLRQLALYGQPAVRRRAVESLARIDRNASVTELITALYAADSTAEEVASAKAILSKFSSPLPTREASLAALHGELERRRNEAREIDNDDRVTTIWSVDEDRTGVTPQPTPLIMSAYRDAADMASRLRRLGGLSPELERDVLVADLAYRVMVDPDWGDVDQIEDVRLAFGPALGDSALLDAISESLASKDQPALLGLLRLIDPESSAASTLLRSSGSVPTPLVQAASSSEPRIRYEAAILIAGIAGRSPYPGSSRVKQTLGEMRSLRDQPTAILVETRTDVIVQLETLLGKLGYYVQLVGSVADLQRQLCAAEICE